MLRLLFMACMLAGACCSEVNPTGALSNFIDEALSLAAIEADKVCEGPRGTKEIPLRVSGLPEAGVENLAVAGLVGFHTDKLFVDQSGESYDVRVGIIQSQIEVSGVLRMANMSGSSAFSYTLKRDTTVQFVIAKENGKLRVRGTMNIVKYQDKLPRITIHNIDFKKFSAPLEQFSKKTLVDCNRRLLKFVLTSLDNQLKLHPADSVLDGSVHPRPKRVRRQVHTINDYADFVLKAYKPKLKKHDPTKLLDLKETFSTNSILLPVHAQVSFTKGKLWGVSTLHRTGDVRYTPMGHIMRFVVPLGVNNLSKQYKARVKIGKLVKDITVKSKVTNLEVKFILHQGLAFKSKPVIKKVRVTKIGQIEVIYSGVGPMDWLLSRLSTFFANSVKYDLRKEIEARLKHIINKHVLPYM